MFITRGELGPENLGELKILAKYRQAEIIELDDSSSLLRDSPELQSTSQEERCLN